MTSRSNGVTQNMNSITSSFSKIFSIRALLISYRIFLQNIQSIFNNEAVRRYYGISREGNRLYSGSQVPHPMADTIYIIGIAEGKEWSSDVSGAGITP